MTTHRLVGYQIHHDDTEEKPHGGISVSLDLARDDDFELWQKEPTINFHCPGCGHWFQVAKVMREYPDDWPFDVDLAPYRESLGKEGNL